MRTATSSSKVSISILAAALAASLGGAALAQSAPDAENGRYALWPAADGVLRLDTRNRHGFGLQQQFRCRLGLLYRTGRARGAGCRRSAGCRPTMKSSKPSLRRASPPSPARSREALPKSDSLKKAEPKVADGGRKIEIPLPSDQDMDRMMSFLERRGAG